MKSLDCNQIKNFTNLKIIREEEISTKKIILIFLKFLKYFCNLMQPLSATTVSKLNFYYIVYDDMI